MIATLNKNDMKKFLMTLALLLSVVVGCAQTEEQIEQVKAIEGTYELDENFGYSSIVAIRCTTSFGC